MTKELKARITRFGTARAKVEQEAHEIAVAVLKHYDDHGDYTLIVRFVGGWIGEKPKGQTKFIEKERFNGVCGTLRKNIVAWFAEFSDIRFNDKGMVYRMSPKSAPYAELMERIKTLSDNGRAVNVSMGEESPWFTLNGAKRDASVGPLDLLSLLHMARRINSRLTKAISSDTVADDELGAMTAFAKSMDEAINTFTEVNNINVVDLEKAREARAKADPSGAGEAGDKVEDEAA